MSHDRNLVDSIKRNFARKSSAQLREIVLVNNLERWSPEAVAAAAEVLQERVTGIAQEPEKDEGEDSPGPLPLDPYNLALPALDKLAVLVLGAIGSASGLTFLP